MSELAKNILKVASRAVRDAQKKSLENGVANVYSKNGQIYFQLPNGAITQEMPNQYNSSLVPKLELGNGGNTELSKQDINQADRLAVLNSTAILQSKVLK